MSLLADFPALYAPVAELVEIRPRLRAVELHSRTAQDWLRFHALQMGRTSEGGRQVWLRPKSPRPAFRSVDTKKLQKLSPAVYEQCRVLVPWRVFDHAHMVDPGFVSDVVLPKVTPMATKLSNVRVPFTVAYDEKLKVADELRELRGREQELVAAVDAAVAPYLEDGRWDGLPQAFEDGYRVGVRTRRFSQAVALETLNPDLLAKCSRIVVPEPVIEVLMEPVAGGEHEVDGE